MKFQSFFSSILSLCLVYCVVFSFKSIFLSLLCPDFDLCFLFNINVVAFKKDNFCKGELQQKFFFFMSPNVKNIVFFALFAKFWLMLKTL